MVRSIVVGTDGSETATQAVRQGVEIAKALGATVRLVTAYVPVPRQTLAAAGAGWVPTPAGPLEELHKEAEALLEPAADIARDAGVTVDVDARAGDPANVILDVAEEQGADLIVLGSQGMTGAKRFLLGSVPNKVSHHAPCSVLIIRTT